MKTLQSLLIVMALTVTQLNAQESNIAEEYSAEESEQSLIERPREKVTARKKSKRRKRRPSSNIDLTFATSKTEYANDSGAEFDLERKLFGISGDYYVGDGMRIRGKFGRVINTEIADIDNFTGSGYQFGFGIQNQMYRSRKVKIEPFVDFNYFTEEFKESEIADGLDLKAELDIYEFTVGTLLTFISNKDFSSYVGIEIFPLTEGESTAKLNPNGSKKTKLKADSDDDDDQYTNFSRTKDFSRDDILNMRMGVATQMGEFRLTGEVKLISEMTFMVGAGFEI